MKWELNKWSERERKWCEMLKKKNESFENGEGVETIVHGQRQMLYIRTWFFRDITPVYSTYIFREII